MSQWESVRQEARRRHAEAVVLAGGTSSAEPLLRAAAAITGIPCEPCSRGDALLGPGVLAQYDPRAETIWYVNSAASSRLTALYRAHEYGHVWLGDTEATACREDQIEGELAREPALGDTQRVEGYGPAELRERRANVFAREFLLPGPAARVLYEQGAIPAMIARRTGVPLDLVFEQLSAGVLLPETLAAPPAAAVAHGEIELDRSQQYAAEAVYGPLLVEAGPGTGKTRTLVARVAHLLGGGVEPEAILALTFSNRAAEEMRSRVAASAPDAAKRLWIGTFHAFGLDLLRKHYEAADLPPRFAVLDPADALALLEHGLPELGLDQYRNLLDPAHHLGDILHAIARAKDELTDPDRYASLARAMLDRANAAAADAAIAAAGGDAQETETARARAANAVRDALKAREVARVYAWHETKLAERGAVDFGDLIARAYQLLRTDPTARHALRRQYQHILVDEYQDVNRASGLLLRELAGDGAGLWVVGDPRQAIYRFRGASPANIERFADDFPGARRYVLGRNYRSRPAVVDAVTRFAAPMPSPGGTTFTPWQPTREAGPGSVTLTVAADRAGEGVAIARAIERLRTAGLPYREQAVLCRSHALLARMGAALEQAGVPVLYLGDLFERPEIRDLLALLQLLAEPDGRGLVRVAAFPEYNVPLEDVLALLRYAAEQSAVFPGALALAGDVPGLSAAGRSGLPLLARHLEGLDGAEAWTAISRYLFDRSRYLRVLLDDGTMAAQRPRMAIFRFLEFARGHGERRGANTAQSDAGALLSRVRRLELHGDARQFRQLPDRAAGLDAVRLLTIHASKGLEFGAVHLPGLAAGQFPAKRQGNPCPPPDGLLAAGDAVHDAEEECLFFVALSRAREALSLSRPATRHGRKSNPSPLLARVTPSVTVFETGAPATLSPTSVPDPEIDAEPTSFDVADLDLYRRCPRQYYYERVLGLDDQRDESPYRRFTKVWRGTLRWMQGALGRGEDVGPELLAAKLDELWQDIGPQGHPYEAEYRRQATDVLAVARRRAERAPWTVRPYWEVPPKHGMVRLRPDNVEARSDGTVAVQRLRPEHARKSEDDQPVYGLYHAAAPGASVEAVFLGDDAEAVPIVLTERKVRSHLDKYDGAMEGIGRGRFGPNADDRRCPVCPHYFICPSGTATGSGRLPVAEPADD